MHGMHKKRKKVTGQPGQYARNTDHMPKSAAALAAESWLFEKGGVKGGHRFQTHVA
jgi:hypothetical protein